MKKSQGDNAYKYHKARWGVAQYEHRVKSRDNFQRYTTRHPTTQVAILNSTHYPNLNFPLIRPGIINEFVETCFWSLFYFFMFPSTLFTKNRSNTKPRE